MAPFRDAIRRMAQRLQSCEEWLELTRELSAPIQTPPPPGGLALRWAGKADLLAINALGGFVKETDFMEESLRRGDRCLVLEDDGSIVAFAWVTFRDFRLALWYTLELPQGWVYLVYIYVRPDYTRRGIASYLLGRLMLALREMGCHTLVAGMYADWTASIGLHRKMGFTVRRRLTQCRLLSIFPTPPKTTPEAPGGSPAAGGEAGTPQDSGGHPNS